MYIELRARFIVLIPKSVTFLKQNLFICMLLMICAKRLHIQDPLMDVGSLETQDNMVHYNDFFLFLHRRGLLLSRISMETHSCSHGTFVPLEQVQCQRAASALGVIKNSIPAAWCSKSEISKDSIDILIYCQNISCCLLIMITPFLTKVKKNGVVF